MNNPFDADDMVAISMMVEDMMPLIEMMKRRTNANVDQARAQYANLAAKATAALVQMKRDEQEAQKRKASEEAKKTEVPKP